MASALLTRLWGDWRVLGCACVYVLCVCDGVGRVGGAGGGVIYHNDFW